MSQVDFVKSSTRHLRDARLLLAESRYDNSFYHSGYVVECALKAVAGWPGLFAERYGHKLMKLQGDALDLAMVLAPTTARYRPPTSAVSAVSSSWSTNCRYYADEVTPHQAESILLEAGRVWDSCIGEMFLDGLIQELP
jgi:HEPN domain-containing protein